jgi:C4-dicarboxylate-specific signal transduction histidine kinase
MSNSTQQRSSWQAGSGRGATLLPALVAAAILAIALVGGLATHLLYANADESRRTQVLLMRMEGDAEQLDLLEWQTTKDRNWDSEIEVKIRIQVGRLSREMTALRADGALPGSVVLELREKFSRYTNALSRELDLFRAGKLEEARNYDEKEADPAFDRMQEGVSSASKTADTLAKWSLHQANVGSAVALMVTLILVGALFWFYEDNRKRVALAAAEERLLQDRIAEQERRRVEEHRLHGQLLEVSRQAGMAEVATSVLHNVGNVLNSVNVSGSLLLGRTKRSRAEKVARLAELLGEPGSLSAEHRREQVVRYLRSLADKLSRDEAKDQAELRQMMEHIDHIKQIVALQQSYGRVAGVVERVSVSDLIAAALQINGDGLARSGVQVFREMKPLPDLQVEKHKALQILVNLISNAWHALEASEVNEKRLLLRTEPAGDARIRIEVIDNGVGIAPENAAKIFSLGFTTRKNGHGFGLHSSALNAKEMGGALTVRSEGLGQGAAFTLELPLRRESTTAENIG